MTPNEHTGDQTYSPSRPHRLRRLTRTWADRTGYFLTFCVHDRKPVLANPSVDTRIRRFIAGSLERYGVWVDCYIAMPDHVHLIVSMAPAAASGDAAYNGASACVTNAVGPVPSPGVTLGEWVKAFKAVVGNHEFKWQSGFFDHVLRSDESASEKWNYIRMNPVRAGLTRRPEDWAYAGFFDPRTGEEMK